LIKRLESIRSRRDKGEFRLMMSCWIVVIGRVNRLGMMFLFSQLHIIISHLTKVSRNNRWVGSRLMW